MQRKSFLTTSAVAVGVAADACAKAAPVRLDLVEPRANFDYATFSATVGRRAAVRQLWDIDGYVPTALGEMKNAFNGYQFGYGIAASQIAIAACLHGYANAFAYDDAVWAKYRVGESFGFKDPAGNVVATNIFYHARATDGGTMADPNDPQSFYQDGTLQGLQRRGLIVLVCHTAAAGQARDLVQSGAAPANMTPQDVLVDLLAHLVPGTLVVPSMVATLGILQRRFRYAYTAAA
jgi:hypothetical protein